MDYNSMLNRSLISGQKQGICFYQASFAEWSKRSLSFILPSNLLASGSKKRLWCRVNTDGSPLKKAFSPLPFCPSFSPQLLFLLLLLFHGTSWSRRDHICLVGVIKTTAPSLHSIVKGLLREPGVSEVLTWSCWPTGCERSSAGFIRVWNMTLFWLAGKCMAAYKWTGVPNAGKKGPSWDQNYEGLFGLSLFLINVIVKISYIWLKWNSVYIGGCYHAFQFYNKV